MRNLILIAIATILVVSCQIEDDNAPAPEEAFVKYFGELASYEAKDIEIVYDATGEVAEGLVVFGVKTSDFGDKDFFVLRTDLDGNLVDSASFGFTNTAERDLTGDGNPDILRGEEIASQIQPIPGGFLTIGTTSLNDPLRDISEWQLLSVGFLDDQLNLLNDSLLLLNAEAFNVELDIIGNDIIVLADGSLLIVGAIEFDRGGGVTDFDNYFLKIDTNGDVSFENDQGVSGDGEDDILVRAFEKTPGGNIVLIGYSNSPSLLGENGGQNGSNVYYLEITPTGTPVNFVAYGLENPDPTVTAVYNEQVNNVIRTASGYTVVGTSNTSTNLEYAFVMNLSNNGVYLSGNSFENSAFNTINDEGLVTNILQSQGFGVTQASNNDIILLGKYLSFTTETLSRGGEGMFVKFNEAAIQVDGAESFFGLADGDDSIVDAVTLPDGKIVAVSNVDFGGGVKLISIIKLNDDGLLD